jgi:hypothetical protein
MCVSGVDNTGAEVKGTTLIICVRLPAESGIVEKEVSMEFCSY